MGWRERLEQAAKVAEGKLADAEAKMTPQQRAARDAAQDRMEMKRSDPGGKRISEVGDRSSGALACPKCGGTQFKAKRSARGKAVGGLLAPKSRVRCVTCGLEYQRG